MLKLYILRHGKAVKPDNAPNDFNRKLNKKGTAQVNQIGFILENQKVEFDQIISSEAKRTVETTEIVNYYMWNKNLCFDEELYLAERDTIQKYLVDNATGKTILLVGHNFGLSDFVNHLTGDNLVLSTSMLVQINFNFDQWGMLGANTGTIEQIIEPKVHSF